MVGSAWIRPLLFVAAVASALVASPWVPLAFIAALSLRWRAWEVLLIGLFMDFMWYAPGAAAGVGGITFVSFPIFTFLAVAVVWLLEPLRVEILR
jgi:hypothetical protein